MTIKNKSTKVDESLQRELAEYGLLRQEVTENTSVDNPLFGLRTRFGGYDTKFGVSAQTVQESNMSIAVAAPDNEPFDMLVTKNFKEAISKADTKDLRSFLRSIVDRV